jgi:hypothetical protein
MFCKMYLYIFLIYEFQFITLKVENINLKRANEITDVMSLVR